MLLAILVVLSLGTAMLLSALFVRYRDIAPIWEVFSQALFYASPVLYVTTMVPESFQHAYVAVAARGAIRADAPRDHRPDRARPPPKPSAAPTGCSSRSASSSFAFALGWWVFHREAPRIAENL